MLCHAAPPARQGVVRMSSCQLFPPTPLLPGTLRLYTCLSWLLLKNGRSPLDGHLVLLSWGAPTGWPSLVPPLEKMQGCPEVLWASQGQLDFPHTWDYSLAIVCLCPPWGPLLGLQLQSHWEVTGQREEEGSTGD